MCIRRRCLDVKTGITSIKVGIARRFAIQCIRFRSSSKRYDRSMREMASISRAALHLACAGINQLYRIIKEGTSCLGFWKGHSHCCGRSRDGLENFLLLDAGIKQLRNFGISIPSRCDRPFKGPFARLLDAQLCFLFCL